jgi:hypothetical protein
MFIWTAVFILLPISMLSLIPYKDIMRLFPKKKSPLEKSVEEAYRRREKAQSVVDLFNKNKELENNVIILNAETEKIYQDMYEEALNDEIKVKSFCE